MEADAVDLRRTPLFEAHQRAGARLVPFSRWEMPVQYGDGIIAEVRAVRGRAGMFDVSHMGRFEFTGADAPAFLSTILSVDVEALRPDRSRYHVICNEEGGIIDDAIVYRLAEEACLLIVNAGNAAAVLRWLKPRLDLYGGVEMRDVTAAIAMLAVQGPSAADVMDRLCSPPASGVRPFRIAVAEVAGIPARIARTGYTGEDGFEVMLPSERAEELWEALLEEGVAACGLGSRDVLRLEAGLLLHGSDMTVENNPFEAGLERFADFDRPAYVAADSLRSIKQRGTERVMSGFRMVARGIPRHGHPVVRDGAEIGLVTSGTHSPTLDANIGMGYVDRRYASPVGRIEINVRGRLVEAEIVPLPFYRRPRVRRAG